jgi:hypothetical protein
VSRSAYVVSLLRNSGVSARARDGKLLLQPKIKVTNELRALVRKHEAELVVELQKWPNGTAAARDFAKEPPRADELGRSPRSPQVITGRLSPWARRFRHEELPYWPFSAS